MLICISFPRIPAITIRNYMLQNKQSVFEAYTAIDEAVRNWNDADPPWKEKKTLSKKMADFTPDQVPNLDMARFSLEEQAAITELGAARELKSIKDAKLVAEAEEEHNFNREKSMGQIAECGCCFDEFALNRMVQCNGEEVHWFCRGCMRRQAETNIGLSKHELTCMSMDGCSAGFSLAQRNLFLDKKSRVALERIEQEAVLRMAGIENLETCPFCPYAAEYPPVEIDKEFRCVNPGCEKVSCRLCRKETHIPKTCAESTADHGLDARHILEEAMSAALIRTCNKCKNPFLKVDGCNKVRCSRCGTMHCYVCRKTITDYKHFNDVSRGGKTGRCPLYDSTEERHQQEVQRAEEETRQKVARDNPEVAADALKIKVSEGVQQDELQRKQNDSRYRAAAGLGPHGFLPNDLQYFRQIPDGILGAVNHQVGIPHGPIPAIPAVPAVPALGGLPVMPVPGVEVVPGLFPDLRRVAQAQLNRAGANVPAPAPLNDHMNMQAHIEAIRAQAGLDAARAQARVEAIRARVLERRKAPIARLPRAHPAPPARMPPQPDQRLLVTLPQRQRRPIPDHFRDFHIGLRNAPPHGPINGHGNPAFRPHP
ncbi:hypothetical protein F5Y13DRAFT_96534 [Hypoxylon sp. FL1857]|nr:hypothetical protein F5Y13DRAFT_96534 [Hypoxylon sp. FL1857]